MAVATATSGDVELAVDSGSDSWRRAFWAVADAVVAELVVENTRSPADPRRSERPWKVTNAFSVAQERLAELKRARIVLSERGME